MKSFREETPIYKMGKSSNITGVNIFCSFKCVICENTEAALMKPNMKLWIICETSSL